MITLRRGLYCRVPAPCAPPFRPSSIASAWVSVRFLRSCFSYLKAVAGVRRKEAASNRETKGRPKSRNGWLVKCRRYAAPSRSEREFTCALEERNGFDWKIGITGIDRENNKHLLVLKSRRLWRHLPVSVTVVTALSQYAKTANLAFAPRPSHTTTRGPETVPLRKHRGNSLNHGASRMYRDGPFGSPDSGTETQRVHHRQMTTAPSPISHLPFSRPIFTRAHLGWIQTSCLTALSPFPFPRHSFSCFPSYMQVTSSCHLQISGGSRRLKGRAFFEATWP